MTRLTFNAVLVERSAVAKSLVEVGNHMAGVCMIHADKTQPSQDPTLTRPNPHKTQPSQDHYPTAADLPFSLQCSQDISTFMLVSCPDSTPLPLR